ncbi:MAG: hypothetical protein JXB35_05400 [Anaerolineae bacterium]|nr:hypothetical protein [Anaerolineae bacterium]
MKRYQVLLVILGVLLLAAPVTGVGLAQAPEGEGILAAVGEKISYQGYLEQGGVPMTGSVNLVFKIFSNSSCSNLLDTITKNGVPLSDGYFTTTLDVDQSDFNGQALWIGVETGGNSLGCQEVLPAPYALSLRPGAMIKGDLVASEALLGVSTSNGVYKAGLLQSDLAVASVYGYNAGAGMAVYGQASGANATGVYGVSDHQDGYGGYFRNSVEDGAALRVDGTGIIESTADFQIAVHGYEFVSESGSNVDTIMAGTGFAVLRANNTGTDYVLLPVDAPRLLFGVPLKLKSIRICYYSDQGGDYITSTYVRVMEDTTFSTPISNFDDRTSLSPTCYTIIDDTPATITGPIFIRLALQYGGVGDQHDIQIGSIILTLVE